ncbi:hypothetical protein PIB30_085021, partial [Stylosanthes scabra]|nr:hypothetical protein [Stylosanthes scabra]
PPKHWIKFNVNVAFQKDSDTGAIAVIARDSESKPILGRKMSVKVSSVLMVEAVAARYALIIARAKRMQNVLTETDDQILNQAVKSKSPIAEILSILQDIWVILAEIPKAGFTWVLQEGNRLAYELVKTVHPTYWELDFHNDLPGIIQLIIDTEASHINTA